MRTHSSALSPYLYRLPLCHEPMVWPSSTIMHNFRPVFPEEVVERYPSLTMALGHNYPNVVAASDSCSNLDAPISFTAASSFINPPLTRPSSLTSEACFAQRPVPGTILKISTSHLWTADGIPSTTIASRNNPTLLDNYPMWAISITQAVIKLYAHLQFREKDSYNFASKATYNLPNPPLRHDTTSKCVPTPTNVCCGNR